ncbi:biotin/lipoyl-binding protein, partial [Bacteroides thetaiotaomicron]
ITEMASLKLDGQVSFLDTRDIFFDPSLGKIAEINVENGKEVKKDSPLLTYNNSDIQATETEQANAVNRNNLQVQQAQENVNLAT